MRAGHRGWRSGVLSSLVLLGLAVASVAKEPWSFEIGSNTGPQAAAAKPHMDCWMPPRPGTVITPQQSARMEALRYQQMRAMAMSPAHQAKGDHKICVLPVDFSDSPATVSAQSLSDRLFTDNAPGFGSMKDFYRKASFGQTTISGVVVTDANGAFFRASKTQQEYIDTDGAGLFQELIEGLDPYVDYKQFDEDGDGIIEHLIMVWAGSTGEWASFFWPHASWVTVHTADGVQTGPYNFCQETNGMGVFAHEFGHNLGLPDLYDYDSGSEASAGVGAYCLMAGSGWDDPTVPSVWCRYRLGWIDPINVTKPLTNVTIPPSDLGDPLNAGMFYRLWRKGSSGQEFFLIENKQQGLLPSKGLMIWHVDEAVTTSNNKQWYPGLPNNEHYLVALEQADGQWDMEHNRNSGDATDAWPLAGVTAFDELSTPNTHDYPDTETEVRMRNITRSGQDIVLDLETSRAGDPVSIEFVQQPTTAGATQPITPAMVCRLLDVDGRLVDWADQDVTLAIGHNAGGGTLSGTTTVAAVAGVATFGGLSIDKSGTGYTLLASSQGCTDQESAAFNILPGSAASVEFVQQPSDSRAGVAIAPAVTLRLYDKSGNLALNDSSATVTLRLSSGGTVTGAKLGGTVTATAGAGQVTFANLWVDKVGTGYTLLADLAGASAVRSDPFDISVGVPAKLELLASPRDGTAGVALAPAASARVTDAYGNPDPSATPTVTAACFDTDGAAAPLGGTTSLTANAGQVDFAELVPEKAGPAFVIRLSSPGLESVDTAAFAVGPTAAAKLRWVVQPSNAPTRADIVPAPSVELLDRFGNLAATDSSTQVAVELGRNPSQGTLGGNPAAVAVKGLVTWPGLSVDRLGTGYSLVASAADMTSVSSALFNITVRTPDAKRSRVTLSPTTIGIDDEPAVLRITLIDADGVPVQGSSPSLRKLTSNPATGLILSDKGQISDDQGVCEMKVISHVVGGYDVAPTIGDITLASNALAVSAVFSKSFAAGLHCLGLPYSLPDDRPSAVLGEGAWQLARYDNASNSFIEYNVSHDSDPSFAFNRGRALWVRFAQPTTLRVLGTPSTTAPYEIRLNQGWNNVANPYTIPLQWTLANFSVMVGNQRVGLNSATAWSQVTPYAWFWDGTRNRFVFDRAWPAFANSQGAVPVAGGIWLWASEDGTVLRVRPPLAGAATTVVANRSAPASVRDWTISLVATTAGGQTDTVTAGLSAMLPTALRLAAPPRTTSNAPAVRLELVNGTSRLAGDVRPYSAGLQEWALLATAAEAGPIALTWPGLGRELPDGLVAELVDRTTGRSTLLNARSVYRYEAGRAGEQRELLLRVRPGRPERSQITSLALVGGRQAGGSISLTLSAAAEVTLRIKGLSGQVVRTLTTQGAQAGTISLAWDGADADGRRLPPGTYLLEATAISGDGSLARATSTVTLR